MFKRYLFTEGFVSVVGSNNNFLINNSGVIKDKNGVKIKKSKNQNGDLVVDCVSWDGFKTYRVIDLVAIQFKNLYIPKEDYNKINAFVINGDKNNTHASNIGYRFTNGRLECRNLPGFYYVPGLTSVLINALGEMRDSRTLVKKKQRTALQNLKRNIKGGYKRGVGIFQEKVWYSILRHRALCLVFKEYPDNVDLLDVNHINGVPGDDRLENLEWATRSNNLFHAHRTGLIDLSVPVLTRNVITGEVREHYSLRECSRFLKIEPGILFGRLNRSDFGKVFRDGFQVKYKNDLRPWIIPTDPEKEVFFSRTKHSVTARNLLTNEVVEFESIKDASDFIGMKYLKDNFENGNQPIFKSGWQFKKSEQEWNKIENVEETLYKLERTISAKNEITGQIVIAESAEKMSSIIGLNPTNIRKAAFTRGNKVYSGWRMRLGVSSDPWASSEIKYEGV